MTYGNLKAWLVAHPVARRALLVAGLVAGGFCVGRFIHPRVVEVTKTEVKTETVVQTVYKDRLIQGEVQYKDRTLTTYVFGQTDGGCPIASETIEHDQTSDKKDTTQEASGGSTVTANSTSSVTVVPVPDPRFVASVGVGVQPFRGAGFVGLLSLDARVLGPIYVGAWTTIPTTDLAGTAVGLQIGVRFGQ